MGETRNTDQIWFQNIVLRYHIEYVNRYGRIIFKLNAGT
jgi:hypothetical protein